MVEFTETELERLSAWKPLGTFPDGQNPVSDLIVPVLDHVMTQTRTISRPGNGGCGNYWSVLLFRESDQHQSQIQCHFLYFSLLAPLAVVGLTTAIGGSDGILGWSGLDIDDLVTPDHDLITSALNDALQESPYQLLPPACVTQRLPETIRPTEYCLSPEPWDRVFHVLFTDTD